ncbi:MAG: T9SS type B sorting domain-containing protein [Flavobacteriaceae bacterium]
MKNLLFILLCLTIIGVEAQREAANWYFGTNAGLDFNSGVPQVLLNGQIETVEGSEAFSDPDGNLLFYTEGNNVWNRFHEIMPNGTNLDGSFSSSQSALAIPNPSNNGIYYVFTPDDVLAYRLGTPNGFNYSVIDMSAANGTGDVVEKNVDLLENASENVSAVLGHSGDYYWVVTHYMDRFYSYRVDDNGVNTIPVVSVIGPLIDNYENFRGNLKISPDGQKIAIAQTILKPVYGSSLFLFDFDTSTGQVSSTTSLSDDLVYYGVEFSSNSKKLYASGRPIVVLEEELSIGGVQIVQFDLQSPDITSSRFTLGTLPGGIGTEISGSLQIGIDKKIYHSIPSRKLSVIRTPNLRGFSADFRMFELDLGGRAASYGLPPFIQSLFETVVEIENFCEGDITTFTTEATADISSIHWDFGDPASGSANVSNLMSPSHEFSSPGVYTVNMEVTFGSNLVRNFVEFVEIAEIPDVATEIELVQCDTDGLDDGITNFNLEETIQLFNNGNADITGVYFSTLADLQANINQLNSSNFRNNINGQRIYARAFENSECFSIVEIILSVIPMSDFGNYDSLNVCLEQGGLAWSVPLGPIFDRLSEDFGAEFDISLFRTKQQALLEVDPLITDEVLYSFIDPSLIFFRIEDQSSCVGIGQLDLEFLFRPVLEPEVGISLCNGLAGLLAAPGFENYTWSTGQTGPFIEVDTPGEYVVSFISGYCEWQQVFMVEENKTLQINSIELTDFSRNNRIEIIVDNPGEDILYSIDDGISYQPEAAFQHLDPGIYNIRVSNDCIELEETVIVGGLNTFFTPNYDGINDYWTLTNAEYFPRFNITIFDRYGTLLTSFDDQQKGWDGIYQSREMPSDDYWYLLQFESGRTIKGHFSLKR